MTEFDQLIEDLQTIRKAAPDLDDPKVESTLFEMISLSGNVSAACRLLCSGEDSQRMAHALRCKVYDRKKRDQAFAKKLEVAQDIGVEGLIDEARRRAYEGIEKPVHYQGVQTDTVTEYSDSLISFLIKAKRPEYRQVIAHQTFNGEVQFVTNEPDPNLPD